MNDNAKGNAKSAGAQLRRYGEQALREVPWIYLFAVHRFTQSDRIFAG